MTFVHTNLARHSRANSATRCVLYALASFADKNGRCWPSMETLGACSGMSARRARAAVRVLVELGEVRIVRGGGGRTEGHGLTNMFEITLGQPAVNPDGNDRVTPDENDRVGNANPDENGSANPDENGSYPDENGHLPGRKRPTKRSERSNKKSNTKDHTHNGGACVEVVEDPKGTDAAGSVQDRKSKPAPTAKQAPTAANPAPEHPFTYGEIDEIFETFPKRTGEPAAKRAILQALLDLRTGSGAAQGYKPISDPRQAVSVLLGRVRLYATRIAWRPIRFQMKPQAWFEGAHYLDAPETWDDDSEY